MSDEKQVDGMIEQVIQNYGHLDVMVNNAAILKAHLIVDFPLEDGKIFSG